MISLYPAEIVEVRKNWEFVEKGISTIIAKTGTGFIPADIYAQILSRQLFLYWLVDGTDTIGFTVLSEAVTSYEGTKALYLDHTYIDPKYMRSSILEDFDAALEDLAKQLGCARLEFNSSRIGWGRRLRRIGWQPYTVVYKRDL